jgi:hypothetical protein
MNAVMNLCFVVGDDMFLLEKIEGEVRRRFKTP